jgi:HPt (histidine-containing phosphotransfer) domain-containing protein
MPQMDGYETAARVNALGLQDCPPIVALTAHTAAAFDDRYAAAGFAGCLAKPVAYEALIHTLQRAMVVDARVGVPGGGADPVRSAKALAKSSEPVHSAGSLPPPQPLAPQLVAPVGIDLDEHCKRLRRFAERFADHPAALLALVEQGDLPAAKAAAHALAGVALTLGMPEVGACAKRVEERLSARVDAKSLDADIDSLKRTMTTALDSIAALPLNLCSSASERPAGAREDYPRSLDTATLAERLGILDLLLEKHNLRARDDAERLVSEVGDSDRKPALEAISAKVRQLEFDAARADLKRLLNALGQGRESPPSAASKERPGPDTSGNDVEA